MKKILLLCAVLMLVGAGCAGQKTSNSPAADQTTASDVKIFTMAEVQAANTAAKCWSVINGKVYDITGEINKHPGGPEAIKASCGVDASDIFNGKHGGNPKVEDTLAKMQIGVVK